MRDHRKLRAFELADQIAMLIYKLTAGFPQDEQYGLTSQIRRAAVSVPSNIVEGCSSDSQADFVRFLYIAYGSLKELHYQIDLSTRLGFLSNQDASSAITKMIKTEKVLNSLIRAIRKD